MKDNLDWVHHDSKTVNENYYQVFEGTRSYGKTYGSINEINVNNIIIERNKAIKEIERLNNIINELENILKLMINHGYYDTPNGDYEGTAVQGFMATGENSEFGIRAKFILDKLKELKESGNNEN